MFHPTVTIQSSIYTKNCYNPSVTQMRGTCILARSLHRPQNTSTPFLLLVHDIPPGLCYQIATLCTNEGHIEEQF